MATVKFVSGHLVEQFAVFCSRLGIKAKLNPNFFMFEPADKVTPVSFEKLAYNSLARLHMITTTMASNLCNVYGSYFVQ